MPDATVEAAREGLQLVVDAGGLAARLAKVDDTHLILILEFSNAADADRIARVVGGPWMRENITPPPGRRYGAQRRRSDRLGPGSLPPPVSA